MCIHVHVELHVYSGEECRERERLGVKFSNWRFEIMSYDALCLRPSEWDTSVYSYYSTCIILSLSLRYCTQLLIILGSV